MKYNGYMQNDHLEEKRTHEKQTISSHIKANIHNKKGHKYDLIDWISKKILQLMEKIDCSPSYCIV